MSTATTTRKDTLQGRAEILQEVGVPYDDAYRLGREHRLWRIEQAIEHMTMAEAKKGEPLSSHWLVRCLDEDWLPTPLFGDNEPADAWSQNRRENLSYTAEGRRTIKTIEAVVRDLGFWEWQFLANLVVEDQDDETYRRQIFENPTRSNWYLCERVYGLWKRNVLASAEFSHFLKRVTKASQ